MKIVIFELVWCDIGWSQLQAPQKSKKQANMVHFRVAMRVTSGRMRNV
jgi:hypothetical protein